VKFASRRVARASQLRGAPGLTLNLPESSASRPRPALKLPRKRGVRAREAGHEDIIPPSRSVNSSQSQIPPARRRAPSRHVVPRSRQNCTGRKQRLVPLACTRAGNFGHANIIVVVVEHRRYCERARSFSRARARELSRELSRESRLNASANTRVHPGMFPDNVSRRREDSYVRRV